ncbi:hypothetical protein [Carboxylicivirga sp. RSCT41]|uniref:hypothetical protein n=1 Tax=Carboxylicivirga agarovorans TaxID=3417570 RepID=UPI003D3488D6
MNYILHLNHVLECFSNDKRIIPRHISMYMALFFLWNKFKFPESIYIVRHELMPLSKIGSMKYYHLTLRELDEWGYIRYQPSKSIYQGSGVVMQTCFNSDTSCGSSSETTAACSTETTAPTSGSTGNGTSSVSTGEAININANKTVINSNNSGETIENTSGHPDEAQPRIVFNEASGKSNEKVDQAKRFQKPELKELKRYFESRGIAGEEAIRFYNHFESNGWKVGGKSAMKDWKAAVRNWILNMQRYRSNGKKSEQNPLSTTNDKNYDEPL